MLKFHFLGTCSGTEPMPDMHHQSWILECGGLYYWFDAGENCAHRAHTSGIDVTKVAALFVSHPHIDHIGGLPNILQCMMKLTGRNKKQLIRDNIFHIYFPDLAVLDAIRLVAFSGRPNTTKFQVVGHQIQDGLLFEAENIRVHALHNRHMKEDGSNGWHSYSFLIEADGRRVIFSGDVFDIAELEPFFEGGCDYLIMETGHHDPAQVMEYVINKGIKKLRLTHHGRQILENRSFYEALAKKYTAESSVEINLCYDGMIDIL